MFGILSLAAIALPCVADDAADFFENRIRPVLHEHCLKCHGPEKQKAGLRVDSLEALLRGGDSGPALVPGNAESSLLIKAVRHSETELKMPPPKEAPKLADAIIADLEAWVKAGAAFPVSAAVKPAEQHWAFQPVRKPVVKAASGVNPLDALLGTAQLPPADPRALIRRMTYDLTGLPPTPEEVDAFVRDCIATLSPPKRHAVVRRLIDRLLASPAYGEKWGRKWLDLARYADTAGENTDRPLQQAWRYRNYVIAAFNRDTPYDEFLREQIAGDLLAAAEPRRYAELIPATGYLAIARRFGHEIDKDMHLTYEDVIDTVGKSVLGLSLGCARCHNHKFDPVTTQDYYGLYGIFASTKFAYSGCEATQKVRDMSPLWAPDELASKRRPFEEEVAALEATIRTLNDAQTATVKALRRLVTNSSSVLAKGEFNDGGAQAFSTSSTLLTLALQTGQMLQLTIHPRANYGADTTIIEFNVEEVGGSGQRWNLAADLLEDFLSGNPHADRHGHEATWCFLDARKGLELLPETVRDHQGKKGLHIWRNGDNPAAFVNATDQPIKVWTTLPPRSFFVHPASDGPVAVAWLSPLTGTVRITGRVADGHPGGGDGVAWTLEHVAADLGAGMTELAAVVQKLRQPMQRRVELMAREPKVPVAYAVTEGKAADAPLQKRGDPDQPGDIVPRKNLDLFGGERISDPETSGRLDLARWLTDSKNPLTPRVMVNRIWQGHFGHGIVATPSDFGTRGAAPAHPELLDWLAATFVEQGWSVKAMHRVILGSAVYQQRSVINEAGIGKPVGNATEPTRLNTDSLNTDLPIPGFSPFPRRRLEAEEVRDTLLALAGELDREPGEAHPFPAENTSFTQHTPFKAVYESKKRSVYLMTQRIQRHPFLALFDGPDANASTAERGSSTVPTQSLYFLNDPFFHARAEAFAKRLLTEPEETRVHAAHRFSFQRQPTGSERAQAAEFLKTYRPELADLPESQRDLATWSAYARTLLASNELLYVD
jgi:hypothetical protein